MEADLAYRWVIIARRFTQISQKWINHPSEALKVNDVLPLRVIANEIDNKGRISIKLSRKAVYSKKYKKI